MKPALPIQSPFTGFYSGEGILHAAMDARSKRSMPRTVDIGKPAK